MDEKELQRIARHEALHCLLGQMAGGKIEDVRVRPHGETLFAFPLTPGSLKFKYAKLPTLARDQVTKIVGALIAPAIITGEYLDGEDREEFERWEQAWCALPKPSCSWLSLTTEARCRVSEWHLAPGRREFVWRVAAALARRGHVWGDLAWRRLVESCQPPRPAPRKTPAPPPQAARTAAPRVPATQPQHQQHQQPQLSQEQLQWIYSQFFGGHGDHHLSRFTPPLTRGGSLFIS